MNTFFKIDDISIGSYLLAHGAKIIEVTEDRPRHFVFIFEDPDRCEELKRDYMNNGTACARELFSRREELMAEMRNGNRDQNYGRYK